VGGGGGTENLGTPPKKKRGTCRHGHWEKKGKNLNPGRESKVEGVTFARAHPEESRGGTHCFNLR